MSKVVIITLLVGIVGAFALFVIPSEEITYKAETKIVKEEVVKEVDNLQLRIEQAQDEQREEIETKLQLYKQEILTAIADEVKKEYIKEVEATITSESY